MIRAPPLKQPGAARLHAHAAARQLAARRAQAVGTQHVGAGDIGELRRSGLLHDHGQLAMEQVDDRFHAALTEGGKSPGLRTPDADRGGAEGQAFEDVRAATDAAIDEHRDPALHRRHDFRHAVDRRPQGLLVATAVVGDDERVRPVLQREPRVVGGDDALGEQLPPDLLAQPVEPRHRLVRRLQGRDPSHVEPGKQRRLEPHVMGVVLVAGATVAAVGAHRAQQRLVDAMRRACVERHDDGRAARALGAPDEAERDLPVIGRIQLLPGGGIGGADDLRQRAGGAAAEHLARPARARGARDRDFALGKERAHAGHRRQVQRARPALAENLQGRVQVRLVGEAPRVDLVVIEGGVIAHHGQIVVDAGGDVGVMRRGQGGARQRLEVHDVEHLVGGGERRWLAPVKHRGWWRPLLRPGTAPERQGSQGAHEGAPRQRQSLHR